MYIKHNVRLSIPLNTAKKDDGMKVQNVTISADSPIINVTYLLGKCLILFVRISIS